jgi:DNA polymerase-4
VASILGTTIGPGLHRLAQGIDNRPVAERAESKQVSAETTFATDIVTMAELRGAVESSAASAFVRLQKDGRAARTVVLKLKKADMSIVTRSVTLPYATLDRQILVAAAQRQVIDPLELGPVRLVGVGFAGLSTVRQGSLFPELDLDVPGYQESKITAASADDGLSTPGPTPARALDLRWHPGLDVTHPDFGHGWVQGAGHGVVTVRFETRTTGPGKARTFKEDDADLERADVEGSLE